MTDYFAALASRVLQPERSLQPRPRQPFESPNVSAIDVTDPFADTENLHAGPRTRHKSVASARAAISDGDVLDPGSSPVVSLADDAPKQPRHRSSLQQPPTRNAPETGRPDSIAFFVHPSVVAPPTSSQPGARRGSLESGPSTSGVARAPKAAPTRTGALGGRGANDRLMRNSSSAEPASAEPVIRIHIGRVDVRAMQPPPAHAPARPQGPRHDLMTLDAYVQQRHGERS